MAVGNYAGLIFLILPLFLLYMVFSRTRRQQRIFAAVQAAVRPGLRVMTTSGVHALVISVEDDGSVVLEIAPGVHTRWARQAVAEVFDADRTDRTDRTDDHIGIDLADGERADAERADRTLTSEP
jgi:preprotein translocase subunit YajC